MKRYEKQELLTAVSAIAMGLFIALFVLTVLLLMGGCTKKVYVPVENTVTRIENRDADTTDLMKRWHSLVESMRQSERSVDSVIDRTKETIVLNDKGDTLKHDKESDKRVVSKREKELEQKVQEQDSIIKELRARLESQKADTVRIEKPVPVERPLSKWERTKKDFGGMFFGGMIVAVIAAVLIWIVKRKRRK